MTTGRVPVLYFVQLRLSARTTDSDNLLVSSLCGHSLPFLQTQMAAAGSESLWWLCQASNPPGSAIAMPLGQQGKFKSMTGKDYAFLGRLWCLFCTTSLIKNPWRYINHKLMDLNMPIKHNEINANVKAQTLCLGIFKGLKLYPQSVGRKQWELPGLVGGGFAHYNLSIYGMTSRTGLFPIRVWFQGIKIKPQILGLKPDPSTTTTTTVMYPKTLVYFQE